MNEPSTLWHYTDANGVFGIVRSSQLRFSDARFLNDRTERVYGQTLLDRVFDDAIRDCPDTAATKFREIIRAMWLPDRLYVCSLSATKESISQWQRYGADGAGYCVGFSTRDLDEVLDKAGVSRTSMLYDEQEQLATLCMAVREGVDECRRLEATKSSYIPYLFTDMALDAAMLRMKNPFFRDELEWRYFVRCHEDAISPSLPSEEFAVRGTLIKPFIELPRRKKEPRPLLPITAVVCGPKLDSALAVPTLTRFLRSKGYIVPVESSELVEIWR